MIVLVVFVQLLLISSVGVRATDGLHASVRQQLTRGATMPLERRVFIMRIDDGHRCWACYPKQDAEHKRIRRCLPRARKPCCTRCERG